MSDTVISLENIGKRYHINDQQHRQGNSLRDALGETLNHWGRRLLRPLGVKQPTRSSQREFWALRDVSFEIERGDVVGIVGRNGAGKSTLLKIISRITAPTRGRLRIRGRVVSLLEIGTGFNGDLTGRENVFLNGAILGMTRAEIRKRFAEIVAFSEIEEFIDTPVKFYSSGMSTRLAFSVAVQLQPEILILDEVLAVGDLQFSKKCMHKMGNLASAGHTVLFVSHNTASVQRMCPKAVLLEEGRVLAAGRTADVLRNYLKIADDRPKPPPPPPEKSPAANAAPPPPPPPPPVPKATPTVDCTTIKKNRSGNEAIVWTRLSFHDKQGRLCARPKTGDALEVRVGYRMNKPISPADTLLVGISVNHLYETTSFLCTNELTNSIRDNWPAEGTVSLVIPELPVTWGQYSVNLYLAVNGVVVDYITEVGCLEVDYGDFFGTGQTPFLAGSTCLVRHSWAVEQAPARSAA
jgi:lipopolysaccharide transport system ATP-binding protein